MCSSDLTQRLTQILLVQRLHVGVLVGEADGAVFIQLVEVPAALGGEVLPVVDGLAAAAGAAAGA